MMDRDVLMMSGAALASCRREVAVYHPRRKYAAVDTRLVVIILRGAMDG
jgi:uncharacterized protein (DUF1501 family)